MTTSSSRYTGNDFDFGPVSGPLCGALAALALALAQPFARWPVALPLIVCAAAAAVTVAVGYLRATAYPTVGYRVGCWLAGGAWTLWPAHAGWSWWNLGALFVAALVAGMLAPTLAPERRRDPVAAGLALSIAGMMPRTVEQEWTERVTRLARIEGEGGAQVQHVAHWPNGAGYTLTGRFPRESGYRWTAIRDVAETLASAKELPEGCPVVAEVGHHQAGWRLHVALTTEGLTADIPFPMGDLGPRSIVDDFPVGRLLDTSPVTLNVYQDATVIIGERGGGKTVLLHNITGNVALTTDCVLMMADLNGGGLPAPWVWAWANGQAPRSRVAAVAISDRQALDMADALERIAKDRKSRYQRLLIEHDTDVLPPGIVPEILVIVDEGGEVYGDEASKYAQQAARKFRAVQRIGRAMLVNIVLTSQRGTSDYIPTQVKANAKNKLAVTVQNDAELAYLYDWDKGLRAADLVTSGCFYVRKSVRESPRQAKGFLLTPSMIVRIAVETADRGPELDAPAQQLAGEWWATRWTNPTTAAWVAKLRGEDVDSPADVDQDDDPAPTPANPFGLPDVEDITARLRNVGKPGHAAPVDPPATPAPPVDRYADLPPLPADALGWLDSLEVAEPERPARRPRPAEDDGDMPAAEVAHWVAVGERLGTGPRFVLGFVANRDGRETKTGDVIAAVELAGINVTRQTVQDWLKELREAGLLRQPGQGRWELGDDQAASR